MLLSKVRFDSIFRTAFLAGVLALGACTVTPLERSVGGSVSSQLFADVNFAEPHTRLDQKLRNALIELGGQSGGSGQLDFSAKVTETLKEVSSRRGDGETSIGKLTLTAAFVIRDSVKTTVLKEGSLSATASFETSRQEFTNDRAQDDAQSRAARQLALSLRSIIVETQRSRTANKGN